MKTSQRTSQRLHSNNLERKQGDTRQPQIYPHERVETKTDGDVSDEYDEARHSRFWHKVPNRRNPRTQN